ncbi:MAG: PQQ-binding-like beta-propeller repeat protein [Candidatus Bathyarchaeia archaeon]
MQISKSKANITTVFLTALLMASIALVALPVQAQSLPQQEGGATPGPLPAGVTPDFRVKTTAYLSFRPNPVGVGQTILVNMWLTPATHASRYFKDYKVTITKPDGTRDTITMDSYRADTTAWFEYVVDQPGEWKLKFEFPGGYFPAGIYQPAPGAVYGTTPQTFTKSCYYEPSSTAEQTLIVQEQIVYSWPEAELPTDYWTRPASLENREWWPILGNYPGTGYSPGEPQARALWDELYPDTNPCWSSQYNFHPWVKGPNSAHIVWKKQGGIAGLIGGPVGQLGMTVGGLFGGLPNPSLIFAGRAYDSYTKPGDGNTYMRCYDIRTGELYFEVPAATSVSSMFGFTFTTTLMPNLIAYTTGGMLEVPGASAGRTYSVELLAISGGRLYKWNPWTGVISLNVSISPLSSGTFHNQMEGYVLSVQDLGAAAGANRYRLINWTTKGTSTSFASRIVSNTSYARSSLPSYIDWSVGLGADVSPVTPEAMGAWYGTTIQGYDLYTGQMLWNITVEDTAYSSYMCTVADHGKVATLMMGGYFMAWDLRTGKLAWKSEAMDYPWGRPGFGAYAIQSAYGMLFRQAYDGVYAFNWTNGKIVWKYKAPALSAYESPYVDENGATVYSFNAGATIADGKMYTYNTEHTESWPLTRGWALHCINITDGSLVWKIANPMTPGAVADGYLAAANPRDGYTYVFGKGKSATTVTAGPKSIVLGEKVVIEGTVLDMSPAQPGTPCVSKESMARQMEYLHLQYPIDGIWHNETITGVPVSLDATDPNGNPVHIGDVITDGYSGTFGLAWKPEIAGQYKITATFMGDDSYGSSFATTYINVDEAPTSPAPTPVEKAPDYTGLLYGILVAVIIAIIIGLVALFRKL